MSDGGFIPLSREVEAIQIPSGNKITLPAENTGKYAYAFRIEGLKMNAAGAPQPSVMADLR